MAITPDTGSRSRIEIFDTAKMFSEETQVSSIPVVSSEPVPVVNKTTGEVYQRKNVVSLKKCPFCGFTPNPGEFISANCDACGSDLTRF